LGLFWLLVLGLIGGGAGVLAVLGPPPAAPTAPAQAAVAAPPATPPAATDPGPPAAPLPPGLDPTLSEASRFGALPRLGPENRSSIRAYARPFDRADPRPRVALVVGGLGMNAGLTEEAIERLPAAVTLAFSPYAPRLERLVAAARAKGMELLLALPLEPNGYPLNNPGDRAMLSVLPAAENEQRLFWAMSRFSGYVGAIGALGPLRGERFAQVPALLHDLQTALHGRGLLYIDPRPGAHPSERAWGRTVDLVIDEPATGGEVTRKLATLEDLARRDQSALGYAGEPAPMLLERIASWAAGLESRGVVLAPVTALIRRPEAAATR